MLNRLKRGCFRTAAICTVAFISACTASPDRRNTPDAFERWRFHRVVDRFQACAEARLYQAHGAEEGGEPSIAAAMYACRDRLYALYPVMEATRCCSSHYIEGYVQGTWGTVRRELERRLHHDR